MTGTNFQTAGDGLLHMLNEKGYKGDGQLWSVSFMCGVADINGVVNSNGLAVGTDGQLETWLNAGGSITLETRDLGRICWRDKSGAASVLGIHIELHAEYELRPNQ
jgi:hypothetical protein